MCGRYDVPDTESDIARHYSVNEIADEIGRLPNYNAAPTQQLPIVFEREEGWRVLTSAGWGLRNHWWEPKGFAPFNARSETAAEKNSFSTAMKERRCLVPAGGYYEWTGEKGRRQAMRIVLPDHHQMTFAGLWEENAHGRTFTILTTTPAESIAYIHDRMPVVLHESDFDRWLASDITDPEAVADLLVPYDGAIAAYKVSNNVGSTDNNRPELIEPID